MRASTSTTNYTSAMIHQCLFYLVKKMALWRIQAGLKPETGLEVASMSPSSATGPSSSLQSQEASLGCCDCRGSSRMPLRLSDRIFLFIVLIHLYSVFYVKNAMRWCMVDKQCLHSVSKLWSLAVAVQNETFQPAGFGLVSISPASKVLLK